MLLYAVCVSVDGLRAQRCRCAQLTKALPQRTADAAVALAFRAAEPVPQDCPCLESVQQDPTVGTAEVEHAEVKAVVESTEQEAAQKIEEAAKEAGSAWLSQIEEIQVNGSLASAAESLKVLQAEQVTQTKATLDAEHARQAQVITTMEQEANATAAGHTAELTATAETWARSQAQNAIFGIANAAMVNASAYEAQAETMRQTAAQLARAANAAAGKATTAAAKAQEAVTLLPRANVVEALHLAQLLESNALMLRDRSSQSERLAENSASVALAAHTLAQSTLNKARAAEDSAERFHDQAVLNSEKLAMMKATIGSAQAIAAEAAEAAHSLTTVAPSAA